MIEILYAEEVKEVWWKKEVRRMLLKYGVHDVTNAMAHLWWSTKSYGGKKDANVSADV